MNQRVRIKRQGAKFCGRTGGAIVPCGPGECYRVEEQCRIELAGMVRANQHTLEILLEGILRDCGPLSPCQLRKEADGRFGNVIGLLLQVMAQNPSCDCPERGRP